MYYSNRVISVDNCRVKNLNQTRGELMNTKKNKESMDLPLTIFHDNEFYYLKFTIINIEKTLVLTFDH